MVIYNISYYLEPEIVESFKVEIFEKMKPRIQELSIVAEHKFLKMLTDLDTGMVTYILQLNFNTIPKYDLFLVKYNLEFTQNIMDKYNGKCMTFNTLLEIVEK